MASVLLMPSLSPTMETGAISAWRKKPGEHVDVGEVLAEIETDKAVMEWELADEGFLRQVLVQPGQEIKVGTPIAILTPTADEDFAAALAQAQGGAPAATKAAPAAAPAQGASAPKAAPAPGVSKLAPPPAKAALAAPAGVQAPAAAPAAGNGHRLKISPYGRKLAEQNRLDWSALTGSGPGGRIVARDVEQALAAGGATAAAPGAPAPLGAAAVPGAGADFEDLPLSMMRRSIARRMTESKQTVPHFQATRKIRAERLLQAREALKQDFPDLKVTVNDVLIKACAVALRRHPNVNSQFLGDHVRRFHNVDIAVAVGSDEGLITPVLRNAHLKGLAQISTEMKSLAERARQRKLPPEDYLGGTFTISNLGMFGITEFNAIINPPQACILAVSSVVKEPVVEGDALAVGQTMALTLSSDHRVVDGVAAAQFLDTLAKLLENPLAMLL
ncbi:MAG TPA: pyruvate dehydrogenase complex dihydrolipoamide acetyltransferase [bacterium]|nr:pyruvate dehydrogenase complex dihydrolipoamide acetyltransferase [bacterium]